MSQGIQDWFNSLPPVSRFLITGFGSATLLTHFGAIPESKLAFVFSDVFKKFEVWRLVTPFFYTGPLNFNFLIYMSYVVKYLPILETESFLGDRAKFVFALVLINAFNMIVGQYLGVGDFGHSFVYSIIYLWSRHTPNIQMSFMFGFQFLSGYLPWVLIGFSYLMGGNPMFPIVGVVAAHIYHYFDKELPAATGKTYIRTPQFMYSLFPRSVNPIHGVQGGFNRQNTNQAANPGNGPLPWGARGRGQALGTQ